MDGIMPEISWPVFLLALTPVLAALGAAFWITRSMRKCKTPEELRKKGLNIELNPNKNK